MSILDKLKDIKIESEKKFDEMFEAGFEAEEEKEELTGSELEKESQEVIEMIEEVERMGFDEIRKKLELYGYFVEKNKDKIFVSKSKNDLKEITLKELKKTLITERIKEAKYNPKILKLEKIREKIENLNSFKKYNSEKLNINYKSILKTLSNKSNKTFNFNIDSENLVDKELYEEVKIIVEKKIYMLKNKKQIDETIKYNNKNIELLNSEEMIDKFNIDNKKIIQETTQENAMIDKYSQLSFKYLEKKEFFNKKIIKNDEADNKFKEIVNKVLKAKEYSEIEEVEKNIEDVNQLTRKSISFSAILNLADEIIEKLEETLEKAEQLKKEIEDNIVNPRKDLINDITQSKRNLQEVERKENIKKIKPIKKGAKIK